MFNRRHFLKFFSLGTVPTIKIPSEINSNYAPINLALVMHMFNSTVRIHMPTCQFTEYSLIMTCVKLDAKDNDIRIYDCLPIVVDDNIPKDEIRIVAFDGTVMSKIKQLALPTGHEL